MLIATAGQVAAMTMMTDDTALKTGSSGGQEGRLGVLLNYCLLRDSVKESTHKD
jgi:hypothetical protein